MTSGSSPLIVSLTSTSEVPEFDRRSRSGAWCTLSRFRNRVLRIRSGPRIRTDMSVSRPSGLTVALRVAALAVTSVAGFGRRGGGRQRGIALRKGCEFEPFVAVANRRAAGRGGTGDRVETRGSAGFFGVGQMLRLPFASVPDLSQGDGLFGDGVGADRYAGVLLSAGDAAQQRRAAACGGGQGGGTPFRAVPLLCLGGVENRGAGRGRGARDVGRFAGGAFGVGQGAPFRTVPAQGQRFPVRGRRFAVLAPDRRAGVRRRAGDRVQIVVAACFPGRGGQQRPFAAVPALRESLPLARRLVGADGHAGALRGAGDVPGLEAFGFGWFDHRDRLPTLRRPSVGPPSR